STSLRAHHVRRDVEGLEIRVGYGLLQDNNAFYDSDRDDRVLFLTSKWRKYVFDLRGKDLSRIKNPFYFALGAPPSAGASTFYLDDIRFE
ncbi:MAG: hypothetical protein AAFV29_17290, partial [Myxococcota bacterium]